MQQNKNGSLRNCELIDHTMIHLKTLVIVAMLASVAQFAEGTVKPGSCPVTSGFSLCTPDQCNKNRFDADCADALKCCWEGCKYICINPT